MGNNVHYISDRVAYFTSDELWIEGLAIQQLQNTANLPHMHRVMGMPDLHPGRGYPIGAAFFSWEHFYPALVGNDIGCGMALWQTDILRRKYNAEKFEKRLGAFEDHADECWLNEHLPDDLMAHPWRSALGSIGGGNHFAELQQVDTIFDSVRFQQAGLDSQHLLLLAHSGSRGLGQAILQRHIARFSHGGLAQGTAAAEDYLAEHDDALAFARANRWLIATRILQQVRASGTAAFDIAHNFVESYTLGGQQGWMHRKGATPDNRGLVIIPGSRGDYSWLVQPIACEDTLLSLAHGAGRKWMRGECKGRLSGKYSPLQMARTELGSRVICRDKQLIYEEAPQAYKSVDSVIACLQQAGVVEPVARLRPVLTLKTSGGKHV